MLRTTRLRRLSETQEKLRTLELVELESCRRALSDAQDARRHVLACIAGGASPELIDIAIRAGAMSRSAKAVEVAGARVRDRTERLVNDAVTARLAARLYANAVIAERAAREAEALTEIIERLAADGAVSAAQD